MFSQIGYTHFFLWLYLISLVGLPDRIVGLTRIGIVVYTVVSASNTFLFISYTEYFVSDIIDLSIMI